MTAAPSVGKAVDEYLAMRRALGFKMVRAPMLQDFTRYLKEHHAPFITTRLALLWAKRPVDVHPSHWATRLSVVRQFARHMSAFDPRTEIPPADLLPFRPPRREPYLYSDGELRQLLAATRTVASETGLRRFTYSTLIGLLAVTGMRISEAIALDDRDLDFTARVLTIRNTKFRKSRLVPLHSSTVSALRRYLKTRDRLFRSRLTEALFIGEEGRRLVQETVERRFRVLCRRTGVGADRTRPPRLHDFRHRLAVRALMQWYRRGVDVERHLQVLSTYLGHAHIADTYWYLSAVPALLRLASSQLERRGAKP